MKNLAAQFYDDELGSVLSIEWLFLATIMAIGTVSGVAAVRVAIIQTVCGQNCTPTAPPVSQQSTIDQTPCN